MPKDSKLSSVKVAILATDGFEQSELLEPKRALEEAGATVQILSPEGGSIDGWKDAAWGQSVPVDHKVKEAQPQDYDALLIPGGVINPDRLRTIPEAVDFTKKFLESGKPIAAICHGPQLLIETKALRGKKLTSWKSLKTDLENAGAEWVDEEVVEDGSLVTSRSPSDIPAFNRKIIEKFATSASRPGLSAKKGKHRLGDSEATM